MSIYGLLYFAKFQKILFCDKYFCIDTEHDTPSSRITAAAKITRQQLLCDSSIWPTVAADPKNIILLTLNVLERF